VLSVNRSDLINHTPASAPASGPPTLGSDELERLAAPLRRVQGQIARTIVGQESMVRSLLIGLLTGGHVLLEGVPGLAKTLTISTLAKSLEASFKRIQFTPDLLPADLIGTQIYNPREGTFTARKGPVFANLILADEINRAPAKVQSALLEAMQERQVTIGDETHRLPDPFLVLATQNPIEQEGTYPLPEAQVDRFMLKVCVDYPSREQERAILDRMGSSNPAINIEPAATVREIIEARLLIDRIHIDTRVKDYMVDLVQATRTPSAYRLDLGEGDGSKRGEKSSFIAFGASPRATLALAMAARAYAFLETRAYVTPHDVKSVAMEVLRHRVIVSYEAEAREINSDQIVQRMLDQLPVP